MKRTNIIFLVVLLCGQFVAAADLPERDPNPYVDLYLQRVYEAQATEKRALAELELAEAKLAMARRLKTVGAVSLEELMEKQASYHVALSALDQSKAFIAETMALYQLSLTRTQAGQDMPICLR
jgi:multidrug resistance efflux pump